MTRQVEAPSHQNVGISYQGGGAVGLAMTGEANLRMWSEHT